MLMNEGDTGFVDAQIVALPGRPARACETRFVAANGVVGPPPYCDFGVTVVGVDLARLSDRAEKDGAVWGMARLSGTWANGVLTVTSQTGPRNGDYGVAPDPTKACSAQTPPGGWTDAFSVAANTRLQAYLDSHNDQYLRGVHWFEAPGTPKPPNTVFTVPTVGTVLDVGVARTALEAAYGGPVCVVRMPHSDRELHALNDRITQADRARFGIVTTRIDVETGWLDIQLAVVTPEALDWMRGIDGGTNAVAALPWLRPGP
jgi:hypothetical protein